jgi:hypothetical protein
MLGALNLGKLKTRTAIGRKLVSPSDVDTYMLDPQSTYSYSICHEYLCH